MKIEKLELIHQSEIKKKFSELNTALSEYTFSNVFLFRETHQYQVIREDDLLFIRGVTRDHRTFIMPTILPTEIYVEKIRKLTTEQDLIFPIDEEWLKYFPADALFSFNEDDSDYLFKTEKIANYPGRVLSKKRNLVNQLFSSHQVRAELFTSSHLSDAKEILTNWMKNKETSESELDFIPCSEALLYYQKLSLEGVIIYVDDIPAGFTLGEKVNKDVFVVHFAKALQNIKGLYQYLMKEQARSIEKSCVWINLEQDLGSLALRQSKHSYQPALMNKKWRIQLKMI